MTTFWILCAALIALALALVLPALLNPRNRANTTDPAGTSRLSTIAVLREQLAQLDADLAAGMLDAEQHRAGCEDIERRVLDETDAAHTARLAAQNSGPATPSAAARRNSPHAGIGAARAWKTAALFSVAVPLLTAGIYFQVGRPHAVNAPVERAGNTGDVSNEQVAAMVKTLADRMESNPGDVQGWTLLARTYAAMQRFPEASRAYARATALAPLDAQLLADHADVMAVLQGERISGEPAKLVAKALQLDPKNVKALALAGSVAFEGSEFGKAVDYWIQARSLAPAGSEFASSLDKGIEEARDAGRLVAAANVPTNAAINTAIQATTANAATATATAISAAATSASASARITGRVTLSPALLAQAAPTDTVFIFARAVEGPRMPLAIVRRTVAELPISFTLDDTMAMSPEMKLSKFAVVVVGARVSRSGNAMPTTGDLTGQVAPVKTATEGLQIVIDAVQP